MRGKALQIPRTGRRENLRGELYIIKSELAGAPLNTANRKTAGFA
nr:MAG TPA: hypothetical protein [Caudoviricetes sp.]